jgi:hypothetical protein
MRTITNNFPLEKVFSRSPDRHLTVRTIKFTVARLPEVTSVTPRHGATI